MPVASTVNLLSPERDCPAPLSAIALYLDARGYPEWCVQHVVEHVGRHGTADVGPSFMLSEDREHVGRLVALYWSAPKSDGPIMGHVNAIRQAQRLLTGRELPHEDTIRLLDAFNAILDDDFPPRVTEVVIGCFLVGELYPPESIRRVLAHVAIFGRAAGCRDLDAGDAEAVDAILTAKGGRR